MTKRAENYESDLLSKILSEISPQEQAKTDKRMLLAAKIADAMKRKGLKKSELATIMGKQPSVITKWLSGTHNFELDTLLDLEFHLDTNFILLEKPEEQEVNFQLVLSQTVTPYSYRDLLDEVSHEKLTHEWRNSVKSIRHGNVQREFSIKGY